jgi:bacteriophage N4 adsorption protein B
MDTGAVLDACAFVVREITLFAAAGFLLLGAGDLVIDFIWFGLRTRRLFRRGAPRATVASLPLPQRSGPLAIFVPAWDEAAVIGPMLAHALRVFDHPDYRLYVGCYPNDVDTIAAVEAVADPRVRLVIGTVAGPTTKADCLNAIWDAMAADEVAERRRVKAVVLHDAEDVVHSAELRLFDSLIERFDLIQLPVVPLIDKGSRWIAGHYADEFAESHGKEMVVREWLGAGIPSAGVGCAISRDALAALAGPDGHPFDRGSITEDYELGLRLRAMGRRSAFVRLPGGSGGAVATRGHFPTTLATAIGQKSRWIAGIALSGWDRLGWSGGPAERWMRLRDRQSLLAALLLFAAYLSLLLASPLATLATASGHEVQLFTPASAAMMGAATAMLLWRLGMRFAFVTATYGWREGLRAIPRIAVGNAIAMLAARQAVARYLVARRTGETAWGKTAHMFPHQLPAE